MPKPPKIRSDVIFLIVVLSGIFLVYGFFFLLDKGVFKSGEEISEADTAEGFIFRYDEDETKIDNIAADNPGEDVTEKEPQKSYEVVGIWQIDAPNNFPSFVPEESKLPDASPSVSKEENFPSSRSPRGAPPKQGSCNVCNPVYETACGNYTLYYLEIEFDNRTRGDFLDVFMVNTNPVYTETPKGKGIPNNALSSYSWNNAKAMGGWPLLRIKSKKYRNVKIKYNLGKPSSVSYAGRNISGNRIFSRCEEAACRPTLQIFADKTEVFPGSALSIINCATEQEGSFVFSGCGKIQGPFCIFGQRDCPFTGKK